MLDYRKRVAAQVERPQRGPQYERYSGLYFFLSLDLVNSTEYKAKNGDWKHLIRMFYDQAADYWQNHQGSFQPHVWKYAGDEVLFYGKVRSVSELEAAVEASYRALKTVCKTVQTWTEHRSTTTLYVKGTCWCAFAEYQKPSAESAAREERGHARNIVFQSPLGRTYALDFLGPEIDAGFRISSGSIKHALVVSAELADLLRRRGQGQRSKYLRIVDYRELKGVWEGRHYPIVWYRTDWSQSALDEDYAYDDPFKYGILERAYQSTPDSADRLRSILDQVGVNWLEELHLPIAPEDAQTEQDEDAEAMLASNMLEVHAVAVCFDPEGRVLVARRPSTKEVLPGHWELGCAKLRPGDDFARAIKRDYHADFHLDVDLEPFWPWGVVGTYSFQKRHRTIPGLICVASVHAPQALKAVKHDEVRWETPNALSADVRAKGVPDLEERIQRAHAVWVEARRRGR